VIKSASVIALLVLAFVIARPVPAELQVRAEYDVGALGLLQSLRRLQTTASVMHTGAHPDDEDSALIARLARGDYARVVYLSLNRGEGGQNTIGSELFEPLGIIRTEELLQARRLDGGQQLFTRAFDFGFSRTRAESTAIWGEEPLLDDMVRAIRTFRPLVVISRFSGTPADGHGHHQLAGYLTPIAVARAADPAAFPAQIAEGLRPWRTLKVYVGEGFQPSASQPGQAPALRIDTGRFDPLLGRSYFEIAMEGRSQHRSQHQGALELRGPRTSGVRLLSSLVDGANAATGDSVFSGLDTSIAGIPQLAGAPAGTLSADLTAIQGAVDNAIAAYRPFAPADIIAPLAQGRRALTAAQSHVGTIPLDPGIKADLDFQLTLKAAEFDEALTRAAGVVIDTLADRETVAPGETFNVTVQAFYPPGSPVEVGAVQLRAPAGWHVETGDAPAARSVQSIGRGGAEIARNTTRFRVTVPPDALPTEPYWLTKPRNGALFEWPAGSPKGQPFGPSPLQAVIASRIGGAEVTRTQDVEFRFADPARGELRRRLDVVPPISVAVNDPLIITQAVPQRTTREVIVGAENLVPATQKGSLTLRVPDGWSVKPIEQPFSLDAAGDRMSARFTLSIPASAAVKEYRLEAIATVGDHRYTQTLHTIAYPHIQTHRFYTPAVADVQVIKLRVPSVRVGYVMGTGDDVASAIRLMGIPVTLLDSDALTTGDLSRFDTIVVGIRASEVRPDFVANHKRLLQWVESGGTLIVQYQAPDYAERGLPPYPARIAPPTNDARVTDERAPVSILQPEHQVFTTPNRIAVEDWSGWVQERSVNDWTTFDPRYTALLESHDPGATPQRGGEEIARIERGYYVYTAYAWFRQLPAGVPGAYRLFANLLALGEQHRTPPRSRPASKP
jgi:LmbE family N-acetylglucosaminyl deacetylase